MPADSVRSGTTGIRVSTSGICGSDTLRRSLPLKLILSLAVACAPAAPAPDISAATGASDLAFIGVDVIPLTERDSILPDHTVLVRRGRIAAIGPRTNITVPGGAHRIDARGQYLMPGLIDTHVHLEHFPDPEMLTLFLANGVTTVRNMDGRPGILEWQRRIAEGELLGPTIFTAGPILDGDPPVRNDNTIIRDGDEARAAVLSHDSAGYDFIKVYTNLSREAYEAVLTTARALTRPVAGHKPRQVPFRDMLRLGQHSLEHLTDFGELIEADSSSVRGRFHWSKLYLAQAADSGKVTEAARLAAASGIWIVPTMIQADRALAPPDSVRAWLAVPEAAFIPAAGRTMWESMTTRITARLDSADWHLVERGRANRCALLRQLGSVGARLAIGTDTPNPFVVPGFSVHQELASFVRCGVSPRRALAAATREAAQLLGASTLLGTVEVGKQADLMLLSGNPFADMEHLRSPVGVMVRGRWLPAEELAALLDWER